MIFGFGDGGMPRLLESPGATQVEGSSETVPMKRSKIVEDQIAFLESNLDKIKDLKETADTKEILHNSLAVYNFVLPLFKKEYVQLARLYDNAAPAKQIQDFAKVITIKYYSQYQQLLNKLIANGKIYAASHGIKLTEVNPTPY